MWKEVVQKNGAQSLFKILAALPSIDMESLKFQLYCSYILVIGTNKIIFKYKYIGNKSLSFFQWIFGFPCLFSPPDSTQATTLEAQKTMG